MDFLTQGSKDVPSVPLGGLALQMLGAFLMGLMVAGIYAVTCHRGRRRPDPSFLTTLTLLSLLIALVTIIIGDNAARAFSLVGTLAIIRFRTSIEDTRDTVFVIFSVACGMCAGSGYYLGPLLCAPLVLGGAWVFSGRSSSPPSPSGRVVLRLSSAMDVDGELKGALDKVLPGHRLVGLTTARGGASLDATYAVTLPPAERIYDLVKLLGTVKGVQEVEVKSE